jgi:protoporphyrinogen/coproporphyrinogen III oxidase
MPPAVAVIGGGISGLAAAYELAQHGVPFVVYDRAARLGGVIQTERAGGYTIDAGPDALLTQKPAALALCRALGLGDRLHPQLARETFVVRNGRLRRLPDASIMGIPTRWMPFVTTGAFSLRGKLRMAADAALPARAGDADESIASFIGRRFGREAVDYLAEPLLAGIHGGDPARLSMRAAFPRFLELEAAHRSVILGLQRRARSRGGSPSPVPALPPFVALPDGMRELVTTLTAALPEGTLWPGVGVERIDYAAGEYELRLTTATRTRVPAVVIAAPPPAVARLAHRVDANVATLAGRIQMASVVTVAVGLARSAVRHPLQGTGFVVPRREGLHVRAVSWMSSKWGNRAPADRVLLRAFLGGALDARAIDLDDDTLIGYALADMGRILGIGGAPELVRVYRWRNATPQLEVGHLDLMREIDRRLAAHPGLFVSASGFRGTGIADCVADARRQAANAAAHVAQRAA